MDDDTIRGADHGVVEVLPRWDVSDLYPSLTDREFVDALERVDAQVSRLEARFDDLGIRGVESRAVSSADGVAADVAITELNDAMDQTSMLAAFILATVTTDSTNETAQAALGRLERTDARTVPLRARLSEWVADRGPDDLAKVSEVARDHHGPLSKLAARAEHQMPEAEEHLFAEMQVTGSGAWSRLHADITSQLQADVSMPDGSIERLAMPAVRGLASDADGAVRRAAYDAEIETWPTIAVVAAAAMNSIKGEATAVNRRRHWNSPLDASLFANSVSRPTFDAMQAAVEDSLDDFRMLMRTKARLAGHDVALPWWDMFAPVPGSGQVSWADGLSSVRRAFASYDTSLAGLVDRAIDERWIDAGPRPGKTGGAFCMDVSGDRSLVLLNWSGSIESAAVTAHELGHAFHNVQLAGRTRLQRMLPMALAETASIFCETLVLEAGLTTLTGIDRLALLDANLQAVTQVVVDIRSRFLFETQVFDRRSQRTLGVSELNSMMVEAQAEAYGNGLDQSTAHPFMWIVKSHYYGSHFYNWPYTYGLLFGLGLFARYQDDPERFRTGYGNMLSRAGMDSAEELGRSFGFDVTDGGFWTASIDILRKRIADYVALVDDLASLSSDAPRSGVAPAGEA